MITINLPVHSIAHARAGDKGDVSNISLIAYLDKGWDIINNLATSNKIHNIFKHLGATKVDRYERPPPPADGPQQYNVITSSTIF